MSDTIRSLKIAPPNEAKAKWINQQIADFLVVRERLEESLFDNESQVKKLDREYHKASHSLLTAILLFTPLKEFGHAVDSNFFLSANLKNVPILKQFERFGWKWFVIKTFYEASVSADDLNPVPRKRSGYNVLCEYKGHVIQVYKNPHEWESWEDFEHYVLDRYWGDHAEFTGENIDERMQETYGEAIKRYFDEVSAA